MSFYNPNPTPQNTNANVGNPFSKAPPVPTGAPMGMQGMQPMGQQNPYGMYQPTPQALWAQLGYQTEPSLVELIRDLVVQNSLDSARFAVEGGFFADIAIMEQLIDYRLKEFFTNFRLEIHQDATQEGAMFIKPAPEQPTDEGKRLATLTQSDLTAKVEEIKAAIRDNLLQTADQKIELHIQASALATQQGFMGSLLAEDANGQRGGILSATAGVAGGILRSAAGLPPAPKPPGA